MLYRMSAREITNGMDWTLFAFVVILPCLFTQTGLSTGEYVQEESSNPDRRRRL